MTRPPERLKNMKLPTAKFPDTFQEMRRQSVRPLKRLSGRVLRNVRSSVRTKLGKSKVFRAIPSPSDVKDAKGPKVLLNLLLVRPWVLVLGLWLLSMATGTVALNGMLSPRKLTMTLPEPALESSESARANTLLSAEPTEDSAVETAPATTSAVEIGRSGADVAQRETSSLVLPVVALVGACAVGSLVISRRRAMVRLAAARAQGRKRRSQLVNRSTGSPARTAREDGAPMSASAIAQPSSSTSSPSSKKKRQRGRKSAIAAKSTGTGTRVLASRATAQKQRTGQPKRTQKSAPRAVQKVANSMRSARGTSPARPTTRVARSQARRAAMRAASRRQPLVSVVPANESHALDWSNGSLAHQMDVRPQRSAM